MNRFARLDSLIRNALSLMLTTGLTSVLGLVFWIVAARLYSAESVGHATTEIAGASLVATLAALNFNAVFVRLIPATGVRTGWFVLRSYLITCGLAVLLSVGAMLIGFGDSFLGASVAERAGFVVTSVLLLMFTLQDGVLIGLRRSHVVLVENTAFAILKLVALIVLAHVFPGKGIVVAWVAPVAVAVVMITAYLVTRAIPEHAQVAEGGSQVPSRKRLASFVSAEYAKSVLATGTMWVLPLLVSAKLGPAAVAYFWIPWLINSSAVQLPYGVSSAYVVEAAFEGKQSNRTLKQSLLVGGAVVALCSLAEFFVVPLVLHLAGPGYAENGTVVVRLLALSLPFSAINALYATFVWIEQRLWWLVGLNFLQVLVFLTGSLATMDQWGIEAVAFWYLVSQALTGLASIPPIVRRLREAKVRGGLPVKTVVHEFDGVDIEVHAVDDSRLL